MKKPRSEQPGPSSSKLNKVVSLHDAKISILKYGKYIDIFFAEKNASSFCMQKLLIFLQQRYQCFWNILATFNEFVINELVKLTMLRTTGPRRLQQEQPTPTIALEQSEVKLPRV